MTKLKAAQEYVSLGWPVTPLYPYAVQGCSCSDGPACPTPAKHPLLTDWTNPDNQARTPEEVRHVWGDDGNPNLNVGIITGSNSGVFVIDVDPEKGGFESWARMLRDLSGGSTGETRVHRTGSGGRHYFFQVPEGLDVTNSNKNIKGAGYPGIDVRGTGGFVVAPPSVTNKGDYQVVCDAPVAEAPEWLIDLIKVPHDSSEKVDRETVKERDELPPEIQRQADAYARTALASELHRFIEEYTYGEWDNLTNEVAFNCFTLANSPWNDLDIGEVEELLEQHANTDSGFPMSRVRKCINSALSAVEKRDQLREMPAELQSELDRLTAPTVQVGPQRFAKNGRTLVLKKASTDAKMRRAKWLWKNRIALGTLSLISGQAGLGKSTLVYWIVAQLTNGTLYGEFEDQPQDVIICATEDSWDYTIKPRLVAAGANCDRVYWLDIEAADDMEGLNLVKDRDQLRMACEQLDVALLVLDPLMSRIGDKDSHKDAEVRQALEPLVKIADEMRFSIIGLMHHNKSGSTNPLNLVMGSTAFGAVARSVHTVTVNQDEPDQKIFGTIKNNLGRISGDGEHDLDTLAFRIKSVEMETEDDDPQTLTIGALEWDGDAAMTIQEALEQAVSANGGGRGRPPAQKEKAVQLLVGLFDRHGGKVTRQKAIEVAAQPLNGPISRATLDRAIKDDRFASVVMQDPETGKQVAWWGFVEAFDN